MEYSKELPKDLKTWVDFLDMVKRSGFDDGNYTEVVVEEREEIHITDSVLPKKRPTQFRYKISLIKDNALEELLADRMSKRDIIWFIKEAEAGFYSLGHREGNAILKALKAVKRILLTQAKNE